MRLKFDGFELDATVRSFQEVTITPKAALQLLDRYAATPVDDDALPTNRKRRDTRVSNYSRDMESGKWFDTGDPIKISSDGVLRDGQHRLNAVVKANVPIKFMVFTGMAPEAQQGVDIGAHRTTADHAKLRGIKSPERTTAVARRVVSWDMGKRGYTGGSRIIPTDAEILDWIDNNPNIYRAVEVATKTQVRLPVAPSVIGAAYFICARIDSLTGVDTQSVFQAEEFYVSQLLELEHLEPGSPAKALRFRLEEGKMRDKSNRNLHPDVAFRYVIAAWNHYRDGNKVSRLQAPRGGWTSANTPDPR